VIGVLKLFLSLLAFVVTICICAVYPTAASITITIFLVSAFLLYSLVKSEF